MKTVYPEVRNGQFRADLTFTEETPDNIHVGQTYYINLELGEPTPALLIPRGSFFSETGGKWIFVLSSDGKEAVRRDIKIGRQN
ncbi:MAG: efflux transporter periplasmic adaptor subunit, partial [Bacteroidaceae bacterium]|nr:efflux transporter periplasmic adaptor subunit [Bacteroidaceae bacterium]